MVQILLIINKYMNHYRPKHATRKFISGQQVGIALSHYSFMGFHNGKEEGTRVVFSRYTSCRLAPHTLYHRIQIIIKYCFSAPSIKKTGFILIHILIVII